MSHRMTAEDLDRTLPPAGPFVRHGGPPAEPIRTLQSTVRVTGAWRGGLPDGGLDTSIRVPYPKRTDSAVEYGVPVLQGADNQPVVVGAKFTGRVSKKVRVCRLTSHETRGKHYDSILAATPHRAKTRRFAPSGIPAGVDQTISVPHDCENHLAGGAFEVTPGTHVTPKVLS